MSTTEIMADRRIALLGGYVCVFMGDPPSCTPYACFATRGQADNWNEEIGSKYPLMTLDEWSAQYRPSGNPLKTLA